VPDVLAYSRAHQLITIPGWHFLTGPVAALRAVWRAYGVGKWLIMPGGEGPGCMPARYSGCQHRIAWPRTPA
jgi:hypothetical protein